MNNSFIVASFEEQSANLQASLKFQDLISCIFHVRFATIRALKQEFLFQRFLRFEDFLTKDPKAFKQTVGHFVI